MTDRCMLPDAPQEESFPSLDGFNQQRHVDSAVVGIAFDAANTSQSVPRAEFTTPGYSRSASVVSSVIGRNDEDISSIMMRGATDLRNAKYEIGEQVGCLLALVFLFLTAPSSISVGRSRFSSRS